MLETHVTMKEKQVANLKVDASKIEAVKQLKGIYLHRSVICIYPSHFAPSYYTWYNVKVRPTL